MDMYADTVIVGTEYRGLFSALNLPRDSKIIMITKSDVESSDSFLAQGGICVLRDESDYDSYFEDTMRAGHYENRKESVDIMIRSSREIIQDLIGYGVKFERSAGMRAKRRTRIRRTKRRTRKYRRIRIEREKNGAAISSTDMRLPGRAPIPDPEFFSMRM